ncbi:MAG: SMI1/KNR4 family protein [Planctomycetaceae bacterium]|jgi:hypothetical protein|nr:SMI1/KNR4 family protein [Planctomycetaceae bacterium]
MIDLPKSKHYYLNKLLSLITPPKQTTYRNTLLLFADIEKEYKLIFPNDYKELIAYYGCGTFCNTLFIENPFGDDSLFKGHFRRIEFYQTMLGFPLQSKETRFPIFPEINGLLEIGYNDNGNILMWKIENNSKIWPLYFFDDYMQNESVYYMQITEFLYRWLIGELRPACLEACRHVDVPLIPRERYPLFLPDK